MKRVLPDVKVHTSSSPLSLATPADSAGGPATGPAEVKPPAFTLVPVDSTMVRCIDSSAGKLAVRSVA